MFTEIYLFFHALLCANTSFYLAHACYSGSYNLQVREQINHLRSTQQQEFVIRSDIQHFQDTSSFSFLYEYYFIRVQSKCNITYCNNI